MKKLLKIVIGLAAVFAAAIIAAFWFTSGMVNTATAFLEALKDEDFAAARVHLSEEFKAGTDEAELKQFLSETALLQYQEASWSSRQFSGGQGELEGAVTTKSGGVIPLSLTFVKENGDWKIFGIRKAPAGLQVAQAPGIPDKAGQAALVKRSMHDFAISVNRKSMEHFRSTVSRLWQKHITTEELDNVFGVTYGAGMDLTILDNIEPIIDPVAGLDEDGMLVLTGHFPTKPDQVHFEQTYLYEGIGWKLYGFFFDIK